MSRSEAFSKRLSAAMETRNLTPRQLSQELGLDYKRLCRWLSKGITRPTNKTAGDLEKLRRYFGLKSVGQLWSRSEESERYGDRLRVLLELPLPAEERQVLCQHVDLLWAAYEVIDRLWIQHAAVFRPARKGKRPGRKLLVEVIGFLREGHSPDNLIKAYLDWAEDRLREREGGQS